MSNSKFIPVIQIQLLSETFTLQFYHQKGLTFNDRNLSINNNFRLFKELCHCSLQKFSLHARSLKMAERNPEQILTSEIGQERNGQNLPAAAPLSSHRLEPTLHTMCWRLVGVQVEKLPEVGMLIYM